MDCCLLSIDYCVYVPYRAVTRVISDDQIVLVNFKLTHLFASVMPCSRYETFLNRRRSLYTKSRLLAPRFKFGDV